MSTQTSSPSIESVPFDVLDQGVFPNEELPSSTLRQRTIASHRNVSPQQTSSSYSTTRVYNEDPVERQRVACDMLNLMTVEELKNGLRPEGKTISGNKPDLVRRLSESLKPELDRDDVLPTMKQMKYVLWLFRAKSLSGRCKLLWTDLSTKSRISGWIQLWKSA